ncbi:hypothetical protein ACRAWD_24715 [Caulobacter segnis]
MAEDLARLRGSTSAYRHRKVNRTRSQACRILGEMFALFLREPEVLAADRLVQQVAESRRSRPGLRVVRDQGRGHDRRCFAIEEHRKLFHLDVWN